MGNVAMMSSPGQCSALGQVRVLQADGKVLHFEQPTLAIQVMQENPGHLVVRYSPSSNSEGSNKGTLDESYLSTSWTFDSIKRMSLKHNVAMLRVDEELDPRGTYYLLPIKAKTEVSKSWNCVFREFFTVISSFEFEQKNDSSGSEKKSSLTRRSRSVPRSRDTFQQEQQVPRSRDPFQQERQEQQQEQQRKQQQKLRPKLTPSISFPSRAGRRGYQYIGNPGNPFMEGVGKCRELPAPMQQTFQHKRHRRMRRSSQQNGWKPNQQNGWKPNLESISEVVDEFSDDDSAEFHVCQSKCLRRVHSQSDHLRAIANLRPVAV